MKADKLILGTANFGLQYGIANNKKLDDKTCFDILGTAVANKLWGVDTAKAYGNAEAIIGEYRSQHSSSFRVMTKGCFDNAESRKDVEHQIDSSLKSLRTDVIDVYLVHSYQSFIRKLELVLPVLRSLKKNGVLKHIGVSLYHPHEARSLKERGFLQDGFALEVPFSVFDQRFLDHKLIGQLKDNGCKLYGRSVFLQGLIFMNRKNLNAYFDAAGDFIEHYNVVADSYHSDRAGFALAFAYRQDWLDGIVLGVDSATQLLSHVQFLENYHDRDFAPYLPAAYKLKIDDEKIILPYNWPNA